MVIFFCSCDEKVSGHFFRRVLTLQYSIHLTEENFICMLYAMHCECPVQRRYSFYLNLKPFRQQAHLKHINTYTLVHSKENEKKAAIFHEWH